MDKSNKFSRVISDQTRKFEGELSEYDLQKEVKRAEAMIDIGISLIKNRKLQKKVKEFVKFG